MRILIIDDSATMRRIMANCLQGLGDVEIVQAADGQEGLERLMDVGGEADLVLADWHMPRLSGLELTRAICRLEALRGVPVILVTGDAERSKVVEAMRAGARGYVVKPFSPEVLLEKVRQVLRGTQEDGEE